MPYYKYEDFKQACGCGPGGNVFLIGTVLQDATKCFNLKTAKALLEFIANGGADEHEFVNTKDWENNPDKSNPIRVDAYEFLSMHRKGYLAFFRNENTQKWLIKSFHMSENRNCTMELALRKAGLLPEIEKE